MKEINGSRINESMDQGPTIEEKRLNWERVREREDLGFEMKKRGGN